MFIRARTEEQFNERSNFFIENTLLEKLTFQKFLKKLKSLGQLSIIII